MSTAPDVSIVIPTYNDEAWVAAALESCIQQSARNIEIICVDDASTDSTPAIIKSFRARDARIRLIAQEANGSAFQARRVGVEAATAAYVLFLDGDDELLPNAAQAVLDRARNTQAEVIGFGVHVVMPDGTPRSSLEGALQPRHATLEGEAILPAMFPQGESVNGHIWRYLFTTELIRGVYASLPRDLHVPRANDLPLSFLALATAKSYASIPERLYRYYFRRGVSGHQVLDMKRFELYLGAVDSIELVGPRLEEITRGWHEPGVALACYESARLSVIGRTLRYCMSAPDESLRHASMARLQERVGHLDSIRAAFSFYADALPVLARASMDLPARHADARHVLLTTADLSTGGIQTVVASQARYLADAGLKVTIAVHSADAGVHDLPDDVRVVVVEGANRADRLDSWLTVCRDVRPDVIIDHDILYNRTWPFFVLAARALGIPTIGWLHSFALRPLFEHNDNTSFLAANVALLETLVTLSPTDVAFWKLRGITRVVWLPNPPSAMLLESRAHTGPKASPSGTVRMVWWGRLHESTKRVRSLIPITAALRERGIEAELTIIGPETADLSASQLLDDAEARGIGDVVRVLRPLQGRALIDEVSTAHLLVSTSVIEGSQLTLIEAQALGLPVAMYELPWLANVEGNEGVITTKQGDVQGLAQAIAELVQDPQRYRALSVAALAAADQAADIDFSALYGLLLSDKLPAEYSPDPSLAHAQVLLEWSTFYAEMNARHSRRQRTQLSSLRTQVTQLEAQLSGKRKKKPLAVRVAARARRKLGSVLGGRAD